MSKGKYGAVAASGLVETVRDALGNATDEEVLEVLDDREKLNNLARNSIPVRKQYHREGRVSKEAREGIRVRAADIVQGRIEEREIGYGRG